MMEILVLINHNNLYQFIDPKNLSFYHLCWAQELFCYYFQIDYCQDKVNGTADTLAQFFQKSQAKKDEL